MPNLDTMIAPRALSTEEIASVLSPHLAVYGALHRAVTHAGIWTQEASDPVCFGVAEEALVDIVLAGTRSLHEWLEDMAADGEPRFYNKQGLKRAIDSLFAAAGFLANAVDNWIDFQSEFVDALGDRLPVIMEALIAKASQ